MHIKLGCLWLPHIRVCPLYPKCLWVECFPSMTLVDEVSYHLLHKIENDFHHTEDWLLSVGFLLSTWRTWGAPCAIALLSSFSGKTIEIKVSYLLWKLWSPPAKFSNLFHTSPPKTFCSNDDHHKHAVFPDHAASLYVTWNGKSKYPYITNACAAQRKERAWQAG